MITDLRKDIVEKASSASLQKIQMEVEKCALYNDLKSLYKKTVPSVKQMEDKVALFSKEHIQVKAIVKNYDVSIDSKACKTEITRLEILMRAFA